MRGIFPILVTPFDDHERVDEDSLRSVVEFNIGAGVHGLGIALGSEILKLTEAERSQVISVVVDQTRGRVPIVVNTGAQANLTAALYSHQAEDLGAAAVMCLPPSPVSATEARSYFKAISDEVHIPVFIQDTLVTPVAAGLIRQIADESEHVQYAKVESPPQPTQVQAAVAAGGGLVSIFGGAGGTYLLEELRRGGIGTMPWPSQPHAFVKIWNAWQAGDERRAVDIHEREIAPLARLSAAGLRLGHTIHKELLRRRGVISRANVRAPSDPLDDITTRELDAICDRLSIGITVA
jgi:dihydrodipicolinate synthase/N-acetylneuraminate lyase